MQNGTVAGMRLTLGTIPIVVNGALTATGTAITTGTTIGTTANLRAPVGIIARHSVTSPKNVVESRVALNRASGDAAG